MKKFSILTLALLFVATLASAQTKGNLTVKGSLYDFNSAEPLYPANVQVLALPDSTYVTGAASNENGSFEITGLAPGNYVLRFSYIGYVNTEKSIILKSNSRTTDLGKVTMKADAQMLKEVAINAAVAKVQMNGDTVVFNGEAYKLPEGATVEELVRRLPGVQISSDGNITVNGKSVSRILVNGKEFFDNDRTVALQNLTADMIEKVKAYDKQSDNARMTGIDDGEEETVLDLQVKKGMAQGWFGNLSAGYGRPMKSNEFNVNNLYTVSANINRFAEDRQMTILGSYGNTRAGGVGGFGGMRGMGGFGGGGGVSTSANVGMNFARNIGEEVYSDSYKYEIGGSVNYTHNRSDSRNKSSNQNFQKGFESYSNREGASLNKSDNINGQLRFEWNADRYTSLVFTPQLSYSTQNGDSRNKSITFSADPYRFVDDPIAWADTAIFKKVFEMSLAGESADPFAEVMDAVNDSLYNMLRNSQNSTSVSDSKTFSTSGNLQFVHRFNTNGRNVSVRLNYSYSDGNSKSYSRNDQTTKNVVSTPAMPTTPILPGQTPTMPQVTPITQNILNRYSDTPNPSVNFSTQVSYTEPIAKNTFIQASYQFSYRHSDSDRATYDINDKRWGVDDFWDFMAVPDSLKDYNKRESTRNLYDNRDHTIQLQFRKQADNYNFTVGASLLPQYSKMNYSGMGVTDTILSRTVYNWTPSINFRYRWTRQEQMNLSYNGRSSQPSMQQLLSITDNSNPLAISKGNPDLEPTFSNNFSVNYQKYNPTNLASFSVNARFSNTLRNISSLSTTDVISHQRITQPLNMDNGFFGNWNASVGGNINIALPDQRFTFSSNTQGSYQKQMGWSATFNSIEAKQKFGEFYFDREIRDFSTIDESTTQSVNASEDLNFSYRDEWIEVTAMGRVSYRHSVNDIMPDRNMDSWDFSYGPSGTFLFPWHNLRLITDLSMQSRRGYASDDMNTDELLWNAQVQFSFLTGNKATLSVAVYDILQQRSDVSRSMTATSRSDTYNNNINSYFLVTFNYRLSMFGDREARRNMRGARGGFGGGMGGGMMGGGMGGFGGGMGGGMMGGGMGGGMMGGGMF